MREKMSELFFFCRARASSDSRRNDAQRDDHREPARDAAVPGVGDAASAHHVVQGRARNHRCVGSVCCWGCRDSKKKKEPPHRHFFCHVSFQATHDTHPHTPYIRTHTYHTHTHTCTHTHTILAHATRTHTLTCNTQKSVVGAHPLCESTRPLASLHLALLAARPQGTSSGFGSCRMARCSSSTPRPTAPAPTPATPPTSPAARSTSSTSRCTVSIVLVPPGDPTLNAAAGFNCFCRRHTFFQHQSARLGHLGEKTREINIGQTEETGFSTGDCFYLVPPRFVREDGSGEVYEDFLDNRIPEQSTFLSGENIRLTCQVDAIPPPQITWYKNGQELRIENLDDR